MPSKFHYLNQNINQNETKITYGLSDADTSSLDVDERIKLLEQEIKDQEKRMISKTPEEPKTIEQKNKVEAITLEAEYKEVE